MIKNHLPNNFTPKGYFPEDNLLATNDLITHAYNFFEIHYPDCFIGAVDRNVLIEFLHRDHVKGLKEGNKMFALYEFLMAK